MKTIILKGNICHTPECGRLETYPNSYLVCENGICKGVFHDLPKKYEGFPICDYGENLIIPGMVDLHIHAPQFAFRGTGMDQELLEWLKMRTYPEEMKYADPAYARRAYCLFAEQMKKSATTRAAIFGTIHKAATLILMDLMEETGLVSFVGKTNMDREAPPELMEKSAGSAAVDTLEFLNAVQKRNYRNTKPILTPRFIPCCSDELLAELSKIQKEFDLPVQSHLSENPDEVSLVKKLVPEAAFYGEGYDRYGLFGRPASTIMAHCVYSSDAEINRMLENGVWIAHCANSNMNLSSGIAPIRKYIEFGMRVGLGSDVAGGQTESIFRAMTDTIQVSKLYWRYLDDKAKPLSFPESFYLATKGGGSFWGKVGSFEEGYAFDAIVIDDSLIPCPHDIGVADRLERAVYLGMDITGIRAKFVNGKPIDMEDLKRNQ